MSEVNFADNSGTAGVLLYSKLPGPLYVAEPSL
jgi:hypothetical protein